MRTKAFRHTPLFTALACAFISPAALAVADPLQVTSNLDDPTGTIPGTLAYAISYANTNCDAVTGNPNPVITFAIPGTGPFAISPSAALPQFYCNSPNAYNPTIDGSTQLGYSANNSGGFNSQIMIAVDGSANNGTSSCGLSVGNNGYGGTLAVRGLEVRNWAYGGYQTAICGQVNLYGNRIAGNSYGVSANDGSTIGTGLAQDRNVISNNTNSGIQIRGGTFSIANNLIGLDDSAGTIVAAVNSTGIGYNCCGTSFGTIAGNVIVSSNTGVALEYDQMSITGNIFGGDPSGTTLLGYGSYGVSLYYSYGAAITQNAFVGQDTGIYTYNGSNVLIQDNRIGTDPSGNTAISGYDGIYDDFSYGTVINANVISGHENSGIWLHGTTSSQVTANAIGTNGGGTAALGNYYGIYLGLSGVNNSIDNNLISGNNVGIWSTDTSSNSFTNNRIGTNGSGTGAIPNGYGVWLECGTNLDFSGNFVGGNSFAGVQAWAVQSSMLSNNHIGGLVPNGGNGLELSYSSCNGSQSDVQGAKSSKGASSIVFGSNNESDDNQILDSVISNNSGHGLLITGGNNNITFDNSIYSNTGDGVRIESHCCDPTYGGVISAAVGNQLALNQVYGNLGKNVNLGFDGGPRPNDSLDLDGGPNNGQNRPVIASPNGVVLDTVANTTTVAFSLDSKAGDYQIDFYSNPSPGAPAGQNYLGNTFISLPVDGPANGTYTRSGVTQDNISALATRIGPEKPVVGDSSEYSDEVAATTLPVPGVNVVPSSIDFGDVVVGRSGGPSLVTIVSQGTAAYVISALRDASCTGPAICSTGSFICSTSCAESTPYASGSSCSISASFAPTGLGPQTQTLALCDNVVGSPRTITFTGNGVPVPDVDIAINPRSWSFGEVLVGAQSTPKSFTIANLGSTQVYLSTVTVTDGFGINGGTCGPTLAGGATCTTDAFFQPISKGGINGAILVTGSNAPISALRINNAKAAAPVSNSVSALLQGSGLQNGDLRLPATMGFGSLLLHAAPVTQNLVIANSGNGTLTISSITGSGPFTITNGCGSTLEPGASCAVTVGFNPASLGTFNGTLTVISDAPGGSRSIALSATVVADAKPVVRVNATTLGFGQRIIGSDSPAQRLTITNEGAKEAALTGVTFTQPESSGKTEFSLGGTSCAATLAPQASCSADIVFKALGFGERKGELQVSSNSSDSPAKVQLGGTGCRPLTPDIIRTGRDPCAP